MVPMTAAYVLLGLAGLACALVLYAFLRRRFLTQEEQLRRSVAMITATVATVLGCGSLIPILPNAKANTLEPLLVAMPTGLGAYALTALIIDGVALRRWGRQRARIATGALLALITMPAIVGFAAISIKLKLVVVVIAALLVLFV